MNVDLLIPRPLRNSGGHLTIYRNAGALLGAGATVRLHLESGGTRARRRARGWFEAAGMALSERWPERLPESDLVVATTWQSALATAALDTNGVRAHFVQDYECWFYPRGDDFLGASGVHDLGLETISIGQWLPQVLWRKHRLPARVIPFTADLDCYFPEPSSAASGRRPRVVAMYQPEKPRRCAGLTRTVLARLLEVERSIEVVTVGSRWSPRLGERHRHVGIVKPGELAALYRNSDVGLSLSTSNPSRVPFEMMAAGLPVVEIGAENTVFDLPEAGCLLAEPDRASLTAAIRRILGDSELAAELSRNGARFMAGRPASEERGAFVAALASISAGEESGEPAGSPLYGGEIVATNEPGSSAPPGDRRFSERIRRRLIQLLP